MAQFLAHWTTWAWALGLVAGALVAGLVAHSILFALLRRFAVRTSSLVDDSLLRHSKGPAKLIIPMLAVLGVLPFVPLAPLWVNPFRHFIGLVLVAACGWLAVGTMYVVEDVITARHALNVADNLSARRIRTQVEVLRQIVASLIILVTIAIMLMTFPSIRHLGESLFASAGLAALVAGLAARSTFTNLIAGIQIALTQPMRLDDVVIVEGEWGWIEEIRTTYVVVRIWDLRRLVVPLSYFIEKPFQNWTRQTSNLLGTVFLYTDYTVPVEEVRQQLRRVLEESGMWDGKVWGLQVTDATDHVMELRGLMSAPDGGKAWDLRCYVREKMIQYLQEKYPESLPKVRAELKGELSDKSPRHSQPELPGDQPAISSQRA
jgi:small-conductance mechanosensitive channel